MRSKFNPLLAFATLVLLSAQAHAYSAKHWWVGLGYYSENALNQVAEKSDGSKGFLGTTNLPLIFRYDWLVGKGWFLAPQLNYTPMPRDTEGKTAQVTITHLAFPMGRNAGALEWSVGPGLLRETIKGKGGTVVMNNGTGTSTFARPGQEVTIQKVTFDVGAAYTTGRYKWGIDLYFIEPLSSKERTQNLMLSFTFDLSGKGSSSGGGLF